MARIVLLLVPVLTCCLVIAGQTSRNSQKRNPRKPAQSNSQPSPTPEPEKQTSGEPPEVGQDECGHVPIPPGRDARRIPLTRQERVLV